MFERLFWDVWSGRESQGLHLYTPKEEGCVIQSVVSASGPHLCCGWEIPLWRSVCQTPFGLFPLYLSVYRQRHKEEKDQPNTGNIQAHLQQKAAIRLSGQWKGQRSEGFLAEKEENVWRDPLTFTLLLRTSTSKCNLWECVSCFL